MLKPLMTASSVWVVLLISPLSAQAEPQRFDPHQQQSTQPFTDLASCSHSISSSLPQLSDGNLSEYAATDAVPILQVGSCGVVVEDVQKFLQQAGLYTGAIDGVYGRQSQAAIAQFQTQARLTPDGIVGFETWRALLNSQLS